MKHFSAILLLVSLVVVMAMGVKADSGVGAVSSGLTRIHQFAPGTGSKPAEDLNIKVVSLVPGYDFNLYNVHIHYSDAYRRLGANETAVLVLMVDGNDDIIMEYNDNLHAFFRKAVQGYTGEELRSATVTCFFPLEPKRGMAGDKTWTIRFSKPPAVNTVNNNTIYVTDENLNIIETGVNIAGGNDSNEVKVAPPENNYRRGSTYYLWVKDLQAADDGTKLEKNKMLEFTIR